MATMVAVTLSDSSLSRELATEILPDSGSMSIAPGGLIFSRLNLTLPASRGASPSVALIVVRICPIGYDSEADIISGGRPEIITGGKLL